MAFFPFADEQDKLAIFATSDPNEKARAKDRKLVQVQFSSSVFDLDEVERTESSPEVHIINRPLQDLIDEIAADEGSRYAEQMRHIMAEFTKDSEDNDGGETSRDEANDDRIRIVDPKSVLDDCKTVGDLKRAVFEGGTVGEDEAAYSPFITWISEDENETRELWSEITEKATRDKWRKKIASIFATVSFILVAHNECATFPDEKLLNSSPHHHNMTELHKAAQAYFNHNKTAMRAKHELLFQSALPEKALPAATNKYCTFMATSTGSYWGLLRQIKIDIVSPS